MERYKGIKRHEVPPHVFAITDTAYRSMLQGMYFLFFIINIILSKQKFLSLIYFILKLINKEYKRFFLLHD